MEDTHYLFKELSYIACIIKYISMVVIYGCVVYKFIS